MLGSVLWAWSGFTVQSSLAAQSSWETDLSNGFTLTVNSETNHLLVAHEENTIWETVSGQPFLSASSGVDEIVDSSGNFEITDIDTNKCTSQKISSVSKESWPRSVNEQAAVIQGSLSGCGNSTAEIDFVINFYVPVEFTDRVAFHIDLNPQSSLDASKLFLTYRSSASEDFYGLGGQASFASLKNQSVPIFTREGGVGRGDQPVTYLENEDGGFAGGDKFTTYSAIPQYISSFSRVFYLSEERTAYATFDFTDLEIVTVRYTELAVDGYFLQASDILDGITKLTDYTGRMSELPEWVDTGAILGIQGGQTKVNKIVDQGLNLSCPVAGVWLQDWSGTHLQSVAAFDVNISRLWWNWESDSTLYPTWAEFVQSLRDDHNVRTLAYINPFLANVSTKPDGYRRNLFLEADEAKYTIQNSTINSTAIISSGPGITAGILDLTNPATISWFKDVLIEQVWSANISGYMGDFGEYTPVLSDTSFSNKSVDARLYHNEYPRDWAKLHHSLASNVSNFSEAIIWHRSSSLAANRYMNLYWVGDQNVDWGVNDGIKSAVTLAGHMGLSGYAHGHVEIGGYTTIVSEEDSSLVIVNRTAELLGRWGELAAVSSAVFRSHEGNIPSFNTQFYTNTSTYSYFAYNARLFRSLAPYRRNILDTESKTRGWPLLRMPVIYHPTDVRAKNISYESFFLGADLYVAPVLDEGRQYVEVYFPGQETYTHVWSGVEYHGGSVANVSAPYGKPAVFVVGHPEHDLLKDFLAFVSKENGTVINV
ncbi:hypothetical protein N7495_004843 [Penicillium taxi]|uniref:uncharacterized protein n=1 Tax=Penicillium taxi TaxID=168475 RepID=UPI002545B866|nr:uncharacterized protein N7495_004843 [Penicillium taxi]KAJ5900099.1 hypothetical protein N7495_004843 [Penicillium taxi]